MAYLLLYSKYSPSCKKLLDLLKDKPINDLQMLCIDNESVRQRITSGKITINFVPCMLFFNVNGVVEKFEGDICFRWIEDIISKAYPLDYLVEEQILPPSSKIKEGNRVVIKKEEEEESETQEHEIIEQEKEEVGILNEIERKPESNRGIGKINMQSVMDIAKEFEQQRAEEARKLKEGPGPTLIPQDRPPVTLRKG